MILISVSMSSIKRKPFDVNSLKVNFIGSVLHNKRAAAGFMIRDHAGHPILPSSKKIGHSTITIAKALALRDGLHHIVTQGHQHVQVEGDSKLLRF